MEPEKVLKNENDIDTTLHEAPCKLFRHNKEFNEWKDAGKVSDVLCAMDLLQANRIICVCGICCRYEGGGCYFNLLQYVIGCIFVGCSAAQMLQIGFPTS